MKYEHQINWANARDTNLDDCTGRLLRNGLIYILSTLTLQPPEWMAKFDTVLCMTVKIKPIHTISYELNEYMPCCFPSLSSLFLLTLIL